MEEKVYEYNPIYMVLALIVGVATVTNFILIFFPKRELDTSLGRWKWKRVINKKERFFALTVNAIATVWFYTRSGLSWFTIAYGIFFGIWAISLILLLRDQD